MESVKLIYSVDKPNNLRSIVKQDLRELGIKVPKLKKSKKLNQSRSQDGLSSQSIFGNYLSLVPSTYVSDCGFVPKILVDAAEIIVEHTDVEGIFRKSGLGSRQKDLKQQIEDGQKLQSVNVHDVTGVIKQFFREMPEPLIITAFHDCFVRSYHLAPYKQVEALLLLCLMLPMEHLSTLRFTMKLMSRLAAHSSQNLMDVGNLSVILVTNIMHVNSRSQKMTSAEEKLLQVQTSIVELLIRNADSIGVVSKSLSQRAALMTEYFGTEDELDASDDNTLEDSKDIKETRKKARKRSNSLQGLVSSIGRGFAKLRRSTDGKNASTAGSTSCMDNNDTQMNSLSITQPQAELSLPAQELPMATPVVMRKRKMSGGEIMPFSASKRKAILDQLGKTTPFTPASTKKQPYFDNAEMLLPATPIQQEPNKNIRKKINLFNSGSNRKAKRSKSGAGSTSLCSSGLRKSGRAKHLFRRMSGGKDRDDYEMEEDHTGSPPGVAQSQSALELSATQRSPKNLTRTVSSPSMFNTSSSPGPDAPNALNEGFIDPDVTANIEATTSRVSPKERGRTLKRASYYSSQEQKNVHRSTSTDAALRRGQPNKLCNGLLEGRAENVKKLRRSFDKSDIGNPIPIIVPTLPDKMYIADAHKEPSAVRSATQTRRKSSAFQGESSRGSNEEQSMDIDSSLLNVVLPPPTGFKDQSMMEVDNDQEEASLGGSDSESEAGFSTISGGTVIHRPRACLQSLRAGDAKPSGGIVHYGSSVSVMTTSNPSSSLQPSASTDSLISTGSESSVAGLVTQSRLLDHSRSLDSGKGSLLDAAEAGSSGNGTYIKVSDLANARIMLEGSSFNLTEKPSSYFSVSRSGKSLSAEDLQTTKKQEKPASRSHSMYVGGSIHPQNIIPNLQISAETHRLLTRAGFLEGSLPPHVKDTAVPLKSPQRTDSFRQSFRRDHSHTCSFRLDKTASYRKRPTPVKEETSMEQAQIEEERCQAMDLDSDSKDKSAKRWDESLEVKSCSPASDLTLGEEKDGPTGDVREKTRKDISQSSKFMQAEEVLQFSNFKQTEIPQSSVSLKHAKSVPQSCSIRRAEDVPRSSISLKRAEMRLQKHDSVVHIKQSNAGHVAQNIQQFNSSMDRSQDQSNTSLNFQQCTSRKRGVSPIRIPTVFAKNKTDPSSAHFQELAQKFFRQAGHPDDMANSADKGKDHQQECAFPTNHGQVVKQREEKDTTTKDSSINQKKRELACTSLNTASIELSSTLLETIEEVITPRHQNHAAGSQPRGGSHGPLQESTNTKCSSVAEVKTSKGLTPQQTMKYGSKVAGSDRSPGKPVKRLQSPRSPLAKLSPHRRSPQKVGEGDSLRLESCQFHERY